MNQFDVVIVGAGMVGASLACGLVDAGFKVALIESEALNPAQDWLQVIICGTVECSSLSPVCCWQRL